MMNLEVGQEVFVVRDLGDDGKRVDKRKVTKVTKAFAFVSGTMKFRLKDGQEVAKGKRKQDRHSLKPIDDELANALFDLDMALLTFPLRNGDLLALFRRDVAKTVKDSSLLQIKRRTQNIKRATSTLRTAIYKGDAQPATDQKAAQKKKRSK